MTPATGRFGWDWDPWAEMRRMQDRMNRLLGGRTFAGREFPAVNVWIGGDEAVVTSELPGLDGEDLDVSVQGNAVTIRGTRKAEEPGQGQAYHRRERETGEFVRTLQMPFELDPGKVEAQLEKGVLHLRLPRSEADKPRKITVKSV